MDVEHVGEWTVFLAEEENEHDRLDTLAEEAASPSVDVRTIDSPEGAYTRQLGIREHVPDVEVAACGGCGGGMNLWELIDLAVWTVAAVAAFVGGWYITESLTGL